MRDLEKEKILKSAYDKIYRLENKKKIANYLKEYSEKNRDKTNSYKREYAKRNKHKSTEHGLKKRSIEKNAEGSHNIGEWENLKIQYGFTCPSCLKKEPDIKLTRDHIIPVSKGGSNYIENIQPLCRSCNSKKYTEVIFFKNPNYGIHNEK